MQNSQSKSPSKKPVIIFAGTGLIYISYIIWSVRSLQRFGYEPIEIIVGNSYEKWLVNKKLPGVLCESIKIPKKGYHIWMWKVFVLNQYHLKNPGLDVVVSDGDILWNKDPTPLFNRFAGQFWFHKLHRYNNPSDLEHPADTIPTQKSNWLDLISFAHYWEKYGFLKPQEYMLSGGLFMVPSAYYKHLIGRWAAAGLGLRPDQARRNQVLLSIVSNELELKPVWDQDTGYSVAKHYSSRDQKNQMVKDAQELGLDYDSLIRLIQFSNLIHNFVTKTRELAASIPPLNYAYRNLKKIFNTTSRP